MKGLFRRLVVRTLSERSWRSVRFDVARLTTRFLTKHGTPSSRKLHLGCGARRVSGWLNVDLVDSDWNVDLGAARLPWPDGAFDVVVSQHVIEHLDLRLELIPLLGELSRILVRGGEFWVSCPDLEKVCRAYVQDDLQSLLESRKARWPGYSLHGAPLAQLVNDFFHQYGEHRNLFDFTLLEWTLEQAGFRDIRRVDEPTLLARFPEFPARHDDLQSLYVLARA